MRKTIVATLVPRAFPVLLGFAQTDVRGFFIAQETGVPAETLAPAAAAGLEIEVFGNPAALGDATARVAAIVAQPAFGAALAQLPTDERERMQRGVERLGPPAFGRSIALIDSLDDLMQRADVRGAIVTDDVAPLSRTLIRWARARAVPSLMLTHGATRHMQFVPDKLVDDHYLYGEQVVPTILDTGVRPDQIHLGTFFGHLEHHAVPADARERFRERFGIAADGVVVVLALGFDQFLSAVEPPHLWFLAMMVAFLRAVRLLRERGIRCVPVIKHRWADPVVEDATRTTARELNLDVRFFAGAMSEVLPAADVLCGPDSNTLIEATLYDVAIVDLVYPWHWLVGPYYAADDGIPYANADDPAQVAAVLAPLVAQPAERRRQIERLRDLGRRLVHDRSSGVAEIARDLLEILERRRASRT